MRTTPAPARRATSNAWSASSPGNSVHSGVRPLRRTPGWRSRASATAIGQRPTIGRRSTRPTAIASVPATGPLRPSRPRWGPKHRRGRAEPTEGRGRARSKPRPTAPPPRLGSRARRGPRRGETPRGARRLSRNKRRHRPGSGGATTVDGPAGGTRWRAASLDSEADVLPEVRTTTSGWVAGERLGCGRGAARTRSAPLAGPSRGASIRQRCIRWVRRRASGRPWARRWVLATRFPLVPTHAAVGRLEAPAGGGPPEGPPPRCNGCSGGADVLARAHRPIEGDLDSKDRPGRVDPAGKHAWAALFKAIHPDAQAQRARGIRLRWSMRSGTCVARAPSVTPSITVRRAVERSPASGGRTSATRPFERTTGRA